MNMANKNGFERCINAIKRKILIPVIGRGLYHVDIDLEGKKDVLLYDYLADQVLAECGGTVNAGENHRFAKACFEFLKKNGHDYWELSDFLKDKLAEVRLVPGDSLWKLVRIRDLNIFIDTACVDLLPRRLKTVRTDEIEVLSYTEQEKDLNFLDNSLFHSIKNSEKTLVYQIFGNVENQKPAYTERDILEAVTEFQRDMTVYSDNNLFRKLKNSSLLFIGCGYDDWLFRFLIRTIANKSYALPLRSEFPCSFVVDDFSKNKRDPSPGFPRFLENYDVIALQYDDSRDFVNLLFEEIKKQIPGGIIDEWDFPGQVFISYEGTDKPAAQQLATNLRNDGVDVWLDERKLKGGEDFDEIIIKAIGRCPVFIPLISKNSQKKFPNFKYYVKEWNLAQANWIKNRKKYHIIPIIIDDSSVKYKEFIKFNPLKIPRGLKEGQFEELVIRLEDILK